MKRGKKLLILLACLALISLAAWGISVLFAPEPGTPMSNGDTIFTLDGTKVLSWQYKDNHITFHLEDDRWICPEDETYQIDILPKSDILDQLKDLKARKTIDTPGSPSDYGLDAPICTITADDTVISIGNTTTVGNYRYLSIGDGKVYMVTDTILSPFTKTLAAMAKKETLPDLGGLTEVHIATAEESFSISIDADQMPVLHTPEGISEVNAQVVQGLIQHLQALTWSECAAWNPTDLSVYGLEQPVITYTLHYTQQDQEQTLTLRIGEGSNGIYARIADGYGVYPLDLTVGTVLAQINLDALIQKA